MVFEGVIGGVILGVGVWVFVGVGVIQLKDWSSWHPKASIILTITVGLYVNPDGKSKVRGGGTVVEPE